MDFSDSPEVAVFRAEVREFLATEVPEGLPRGQRLLTTGDRTPAMREWERRVAARGWMAPGWPKQYGGAGLAVVEQFVLNEEFALERVPQPITGVGISLVGPTLIAHGTEEQRVRHLPGILDGTNVWCQGFSEPGAGSDLAGLNTRARRDGDDYVIDGQKIWTSYARYADWIVLLARTDPDAAKHRGITYLLVPMDSPGITIRPLVQITGEASFNEVFFEAVRVPAQQRVGEENLGWYIATTTLEFERSSVVLTVSAQQAIGDLVEAVRARECPAPTAAARLELASRAVEARVAVLMSHRVVSLQAAGLVSNYEQSMTKLFVTELHQRIAQTGCKLGGLRAQLLGPDGTSCGVSFAYNLLSSIPLTIAAGTSEIQRNIIATRGLGLPR